MKVLQTLATVFIISSCITACNDSNVKSETVEQEGEYKYTPYKDLKYTQASIKPGTEVKILAHLGGRKSSGDTVFYYQFIVQNLETGDTIRILCPEITIDESAGIDNKTTVSPLAYNESKGVTTAFFELVDSSDNLLLNGENLSKLVEGTDSGNINKLLDPSNAIKIVVLDKNDSEDRISRFKTAAGILNFKKIPW